MRKKLVLILNLIIIALGVIGTIIMLQDRPSETGLTASGAENLKYFTVLSNEFCGIVSIIWLVLYICDWSQGTVKVRRWMTVLKYMAVTAVGLTFLVIAAFLGPIYGHAMLYKNSNLYFHLLLPVVAMIEFAFFDTGERKLPFKNTFLTVIPTLVYGMAYLVNLLVNGVGEWPDTNDWYGFVNWGLPVGLGIFAGIIVATWGIACVLRLVNNKVSGAGKDI